MNVATKENRTSERTMENKLYKGFIIKKSVHESRNATAGIFRGIKKRFNCACLNSWKHIELPLKKTRATENERFVVSLHA